MTESQAAALSRSNLREKIIVALDVGSGTEARAIAKELEDSVGGFKIGLQLFVAEGPEIVREMVAAGHRVFLDLKFHDIPNTVAKAAVEAAKLGVWMFDVHAGGGGEMMRESVRQVSEFCAPAGIERPLMIGVTVLTSTNDDTLREIGVDSTAEDQVARFARLAFESGLDGVVASAREVPIIRKAVPHPGFLTITPGIRPMGATGDDQKRVTTFGQALRNGADRVVIGRPIVGAEDRVRAVNEIIEEVLSDH